MICSCGCNEEFIPRTNKQRFKTLHNRFKKKPESKKIFTGYWRAKELVSTKNKKCELIFTNQCKGNLEIHHKDENPMNNDLSNLSILCRCHHKLIHNKTISYEKPKAKFRIDGSGKRRYDRSSNAA